jgi:predicted acylesterase/phospholipase RssA
MADVTVALEGCAGRAAFQIGVLQWLAGQGIHPAAVAGASAGSIVAAAVAFDQLEGLEDLWLGVAGSRVFRPERLLRLGWPLAMSDIVGLAMREAFDGRSLADAILPVSIPVTHLHPVPRRRFLRREDCLPVADAVLASCFVPGPYHRVIRIDGRPAFDGAWLLRTPVDAASPGDPVLAIVSNPHGLLKTGYFRPGTRPWPANCRVIHPDRPLPVGAYDTDPARMRATIAEGRRAAAVFARSEARWLADLSRT